MRNNIKHIIDKAIFYTPNYNSVEYELNKEELANFDKKLKQYPNNIYRKVVAL
jgi:hypothetical protein